MRINAKNMLIIGGAPKSGTTSLYYYLKQHPALCLPEKKELHYFSLPWLEKRQGGPGDRYVIAEIPRTFEAYRSFYSACASDVLPVDISPSYLVYPDSAWRIREKLPGAKIVLFLRNPTDKAFSQYLHLVGEGRETLPFHEALAAEDVRQAEGYSDMWLYRSSGYYGERVSSFINAFGDENVRIFLYEDIQRNIIDVVREICRFVGVNPNYSFERISEANRSGAPRSQAVARYLLSPNPVTWLLRRIIPQSLGREMRARIKSMNTGRKPTMPEEVRKKLLEVFREDICRLESIIGRSTGWL